MPNTPDKDDPLWRFPWHLPTPREGEQIDVVQLMTMQAAKHPRGTPYHADAQLELLRVLSMTNCLDAAVELVDELLAEDLPMGRQCAALVMAGTCAERSKRFDIAVRLYRAAIDAGSDHTAEQYFSRNNLAYSLNQLGKFEEALPFARQAIEIDPERFNAHKNLGVALEGLGQLEQAAEAYLRSTYLCPFDRRSYQHLVAMVKGHPELLESLAYLASEIEHCASVMRVATTRAH